MAADTSKSTQPLYQFWIIAICCTLLVSLPCHSQPLPDHLVFSTGTMTKKRIEHETAAIKLALEKSRDRYGDYLFDVDRTSYSRTRILRSLLTGRTINTISAPEQIYFKESASPPLLIVPVPLLYGTLGKRLLIVKRERVSEFNNLNSRAELAKYSAGLGFDWIDTQIFAQNQLPFTTGTDPQQLFTMLAHERYDYLPLGMLEADAALEASGMSQQLAIVEDLLLEYPLPVYLQLSPDQTRLAQRLEYGLEKATQDGSLKTLFEQYYDAQLEAYRDFRRITLPAND
ncbi:hypothetical protein [Gilvimarinus chinensis]|uniref:hypothetical protein n=1 Tax=Gilvimarinus chinensis TaxID=396005 RepID=UPI000368B84C|nr:hypothetical protein [Gilvimarinus chinensis]